MSGMLIIILLALWVLAMLTSFTLYGFAHFLLFIAIALTLKIISESRLAR
jgi:hypothetical protein